MGTLAIRNYSRFQHYKDRRPPWVKFYVETLADTELSELPPATRLTACLLLLIAANRDNRFPADATWLAVECSISRPQAKRALAELQAIKYLIPASELASNGASGSDSNGASETASPSRAPAHSRRGRDRDRKPPTPFSPSASNRNCPHCGIVIRPPTTLADHLYASHDIEEPA